MTIMHKKVGSINLKWNKRNIKRERKNNKLTKNIKTFAKLWYIIKEWTSLSQSWFWQCHTSPSVKNLLFSSFYHVCLLFSISIPFRSLSRSLLFFCSISNLCTFPSVSRLFSASNFCFSWYGFTPRSKHQRNATCTHTGRHAIT